MAYDDDIAELLSKMGDTIDKSSSEASREAVAYIRTLGIIDLLAERIDDLDEEVDALARRVRTLEKRLKRAIEDPDEKKRRKKR